LAGDYPNGKLAIEAHHSREGVVCRRERVDLPVNLSQMKQKIAQIYDQVSKTFRDL